MSARIARSLPGRTTLTASAVPASRGGPTTGRYSSVRTARCTCAIDALARLVVELSEELLGSAPEVGGDHLANCGCGQRGDAVLKLLHLEDELGAEEVGPHRDQLAQLHERRPEPLEGES